MAELLEAIESDVPNEISPHIWKKPLHNMLELTKHTKVHQNIYHNQVVD